MSEYGHSGFLENKDSEHNPHSSLRENLDMHFGNDDKEKLKDVKATLDRMRAQRKNLGEMDSVNHNNAQVHQMVELENEIPIYEAMQAELEAMMEDAPDKIQGGITELGKID